MTNLENREMELVICPFVHLIGKQEMDILNMPDLLPDPPPFLLNELGNLDLSKPKERMLVAYSPYSLPDACVLPCPTIIGQLSPPRPKILGQCLLENTKNQTRLIND